MQREITKRRSYEQNYRLAAHAIADKLYKRLQNSKLPIRVAIRDFWDMKDYLSSDQKRETAGAESYIAAQVRKRLRKKYGASATAISQDAFTRTVPELQKLSVENVMPYVKQPTVGMWITGSPDGNMFVAAEEMNDNTQILARIKARENRVTAELDKNRLSKPAKAALVQDTKKLLKAVQMRLTF